MIKLNKARFCGLLYVCTLVLFSCSAKEKKVKEAVVFQYPKDSLWRGIPMKKNTGLYKKNAFPSYTDSVLLFADAYNNFNYYAGIQKNNVPALLNRLNNQQYINYAYLTSLGVPADKN